MTILKRLIEGEIIHYNGKIVTLFSKPFLIVVVGGGGSGCFDETMTPNFMLHRSDKTLVLLFPPIGLSSSLFSFESTIIF
jgi:hypothetical protein